MINVISHRGANKRAPQNTIPAFEASIQIGVDGFETDVHLTKDKIPVICHNYTIDETSTGNGNISDKTLEELLKYDFGQYFDKSFIGTKIPTLDEFLELCSTTFLKIMNIEIKPPKDKNLEIVKLVIDAVKKFGLLNQLVISSFSKDILRECKNIDENVKTALLYDPKPSDGGIVEGLFKYVEVAKELKVSYMHPHSIFVSKRYVKNLHKIGVGVNPWTVDSKFEIKRMISCGVDGIITNVPDLVNNLIKEE